jgi:predicted nucleic acid-binding protein
VNRRLLDTNIISNITKPWPSEASAAWMAEQADEDLFISSLTVVEIRRAILEKPAGRKRRELEAWFSGPEGPQALFAGRVLPFDERARLIWARLMAQGTAKGQPRSPLDMIHCRRGGNEQLRDRDGKRKGVRGAEGGQPDAGGVRRSTATAAQESRLARKRRFALRTVSISESVSKG